jgi:hypothetical protein
MNTVGDILKLGEQGHRTLVLTGEGMDETSGSQSHFNERMKELIISTFVSFCIPPSEARNCKRSTLPSLDEMCLRLKGLNQDLVLRRTAQANYYCAVAVLLTMDGHTEDDLIVQQVRAQSLINSGLLSSLEHA